MLDAGQDRERVAALGPALAHPAAVALAAVEERERLDRVARREHVGVGGDEHRRDLEPADLVAEVEVLGHRRAHLLQQPREVLGPRREPHVRLVHRRALQVVRRCGADLALLGEHVRVDRAAPDVGRDDDQLPDELGVVDRRLERDAAAERVADEVGLVEPEVVDEGGDVVAHRDDAQRPVDVGGPPVALEVGGDDPVPGGELVDHWPEHLARPEPAVEQDERPATAVDLVVQVDAVDVGVGAGALGLGGPFGHGHVEILRVGRPLDDTPVISPSAPPAGCRRGGRTRTRPAARAGGGRRPSGGRWCPSPRSPRRP